MLNYLYKTPKQSAYLIIIFLALFSAIYNAFLPLHGDEAYYWMWSQHLQLSYYDHPPMIAYLIYLADIVSESEWGVRLVNVFCMSVSALYIFKLSALMFNEKIALNAVLIFSSIILVHAGFIITTPDSPLVLFWSLTLYYSYKAIFFERRKDFIIAGIMLGLMMLSKYTAILFVPFLLTFILLKKRAIFKNIDFYIAVIIAGIVVSPMVYWNYQHDWISFAFQLNHGSDKSYIMHPVFLVNYLLGQFGIFSPVFAGVLLFFLFKDKLYFRDKKLFFLALNSVTVLLFFFYKNLYVKMELNYTAPAYVAGTILTAYIFSKYELNKTFKIGLIIALFFTILGRILFITNLEIVQDRMYGNKQAVKLLATYAKKGDHFYGDHLTIAALLKYYLPNHPDTDLALPSRFSQYDMWRKKDYLKDGLVLTRDKENKRLKKEYKDVVLLNTLTVKKGLHGSKTFYIYRVAKAK